MLSNNILYMYNTLHQVSQCFNSYLFQVFKKQSQNLRSDKNQWGKFNKMEKKTS